ncbi:hypothetical protein EVAR_45646_1 [Eumeta japonica]|uniref:Uncharacterized protein n=1 Tax=Eumeta variegata TaxID=151549 RepID=A0A4C1Y731_EUMVA|nr:hypothetical protein EVAR_45646_1 [Eumeta japonica]
MKKATAFSLHCTGSRLTFELCAHARDRAGYITIMARIQDSQGGERGNLVRRGPLRSRVGVRCAMCGARGAGSRTRVAQPAAPVNGSQWARGRRFLSMNAKSRRTHGVVTCHGRSPQPPLGVTRLRRCSN